MNPCGVFVSFDRSENPWDVSNPARFLLQQIVDSPTATVLLGKSQDTPEMARGERKNVLTNTNDFIFPPLKTNMYPPEN